MNLKNFIQRHPLLTYFVLVYAIAWGGILLVVQALASPGEAGSGNLLAIVGLPMLITPGIAGITVTALVDGRAGLKAMLSRMTRWRVVPRWYAVALATMPLLVLAILYALALLISPAFAPALIFPQFTMPKRAGTYQVATAWYTYTDASRIETFTTTGENRKVNVEFWYPQDSNRKYPLIVFSHGAFGVKASNTSTFMELASNGYVVGSIDHPYHSLFTIDTDGHLATADPSYIQEVTGANNGKYDEAANFKLTQKWMTVRTKDINFVLNTIKEHAKNPGSGEVYRRIDPEKIGLMGHSLGGAASAQVARERDDIDAVINLDADLLGEYLDYVDGKYVINDKIYPAPILTVYADDMVRLMDAIKDPNVIIAVKHVTATAPKAYEVHLTGTNHMSLTDLPLVSPFLVSMINASVPKGGGDEADKYATIENRP